MNTYLSKYIKVMIALLITGGAIFLISCGRGKTESDTELNESMLTQQSDTLVIIQSTNGKVAYRFETPLLERYDQAREPYMEFRKGVKVEKIDSTGAIESTLVSDYAIFFEIQKLWEAKGNVVATNSQGHVLETQQLFWNQRTKKIYSNIDSKVTQGEDLLVGVGFESDEDFNEWEVRRPRGRAAVSLEPNTDTTSRASVDKTKTEPNKTTASQTVIGQGVNNDLQTDKTVVKDISNIRLEEPQNKEGVGDNMMIMRKKTDQNLEPKAINKK